MRYDQGAHRREAYGVRGSSTNRSDSLCPSSMSRGEGTCMASYRGITQGATTATVQGPASSPSARNRLQTSGGRGLTRAALYARVSTDKQEREETVASQVDLLRQTAEAGGYEVPPGNIFIDDGVSGSRLDRPALERLRDLAAEGAFEVVLVTAPDRLARRYAYQVVLVEELTRCGCEVVFVHQSLGASPEEQMLLSEACRLLSSNETWDKGRHKPEPYPDVK